MTAVLVTGGTGFIGRYVCDELAVRDYDPLVFDRRGRPLGDYEVTLGDVRDSTAVTEAVAHADAVIHLAAVLGTAETIHNPRPAAETNIMGTLNVFEAVAQYDVPAVYICVGNHWMENTYSITKTTAERFSRMFNQYRGTRIAAVRVLNAYGPGQAMPQPWGASKVRKIIPTFAAQALTGGPIEVYGDGKQVMDMVYVPDVARALVDALEMGPHPDGVTYEVGTGTPTTVNHIATEVNRQVGASSVTHLEMRDGEPPGSVVLADVSTLGPLGWLAADFTTLKDGLAATIPTFASQLS